MELSYLKWLFLVLEGTIDSINEITAPIQGILIRMQSSLTTHVIADSNYVFTTTALLIIIRIETHLSGHTVRIERHTVTQVCKWTTYKYIYMHGS